MRVASKELWMFAISRWKQRSTERHGTDGAISLEKETALEAVSVYQTTIGNASPTDSIVLHHTRVDEILKWMKDHLDAYLASADVIIEQRNEPG
jgi:hypothetical protein